MPADRQVVGLIEIDTEPAAQSSTDTTLGETLVLLRGVPTEASSPAEACQIRRWRGVDREDRQTLRADLAQLASELEAEYRQLLSSLPSATTPST